jgi:hypothetical protein
MLRLGLLVTVVPLALAGGIAPGLMPHADPVCIATGTVTFQMAAHPWQANRRVTFTANRQLATVRVQLVDQPEIADFVVANDETAASETSCAVTANTRRVAIVEKVAAGDPIIYLSAEPGADYRIFVHLGAISAHDAAALIVSARGSLARMASADALRRR